jgi:hypothetical protein
VEAGVYYSLNLKAPPRRKTYEQKATREKTPEMNGGVDVLAVRTTPTYDKHNPVTMS